MRSNAAPSTRSPAGSVVPSPSVEGPPVVDDADSSSPQAASTRLQRLRRRRRGAIVGRWAGIQGNAMVAWVPDGKRPPGALALIVDGRAVEVPDDGATLLAVLRDGLGVRSVKDGCSPQGQCGCCTVLVDGQPRVACVTPARRVAGRRITTVDGLDDAGRWAAAFCATGASQCGFCTPGIIVRLAAEAAQAGRRRSRPGAARPPVPVHRLAADPRRVGPRHERGSGGRPAIDPVRVRNPLTSAGSTTPDVAARRSGPRLRKPVTSAGSTVADRAVGGDPMRPPAGASRAAYRRWSGPTCRSAAPVRRRHRSRRRARRRTRRRRRVGRGRRRRRGAGGRGQGPGPAHDRRRRRRRSSCPGGTWALTLRTSWVEPAYLETDASWCEPGGEPASPARQRRRVRGQGPLARAGCGPRAGRPPRPSGARPAGAARTACGSGPSGRRSRPASTPSGRGVVRVARTPGIAEALRVGRPASISPSRRSTCPARRRRPDLRAAGWAEAAVAGRRPPRRARGHRRRPRHRRPGDGARRPTGRIHVRVACGDAARRGRAALLLHRRHPPGPRMGDERGPGRRRRRRGARPHHPQLRRAPRRRHGPGRRRDRRGLSARRCGAAMPCSPRWRAPSGSRKAARPSGRQGGTSDEQAGWPVHAGRRGRGLGRRLRPGRRRRRRASSPAASTASATRPSPTSGTGSSPSARR